MSFKVLIRPPNDADSLRAILTHFSENIIEVHQQSRQRRFQKCLKAKTTDILDFIFTTALGIDAIVDNPGY
jgi:hypothetical protein